MPDSFDYTTGTNSENVRLLQALIDDAPEYTEETNSRNANILKSIINNTEYTDAPQSEIEELFLRLKAKIGGEIEVDELNVTENGTYDAGVNKAYNPVTVELPLDSKTITENGTYTASDDNLAGFDEVTVAVEGYAKKSIPNTPTAIATFNASALPMPSLSVGIEPVQDLHGYDNPWTAGGGRNLFNMGSKWSGTASGLTFNTDDNYVTINGTKNGGTYVTANELGFELSAGTYYVKTIIIGGTASNQPQLTLIGNDISTGDTIENERTFTLSDTTSISVRFAFWNDGATFNNYKLGIVVSKTPNIDKFYPYSNECPISGWSAVNVNRSAKNMFKIPSEFVGRTTRGITVSANSDMTYSVSGLSTNNASINLSDNSITSNYYTTQQLSNTIKYPAGTYTISGETNTVEGGFAILCGTNIGGVYSAEGNSYNDIKNKSVTITMATEWYMNPLFSMSNNKQVSDNAYLKVQVERGETATTYEPYNGTTYTTQLKDGQGNPLTCYGGELTNENGVQTLELTHGYIASYNGETLPSTWISDRDVYAEGTTPTTGAEVVYELATPQQIPQDNLAISTQDGTNNIWADSGDIQSGEYMEEL